jgi:predicted PurR-regulated permease PerM
MLTGASWCRPLHRRRLLVVIYFAIIIAFITLFGVMTIPDIVREGADFIRRLKSDNVWVILVEKMRHGLGWVHKTMQHVSLCVKGACLHCK